MEKPLVSIILPAYQAERTIANALESVYSQTYQNWECLIIDDCSSDQTVPIIKRFLEKDARFRLIQNNENIKVAKTRNKGISEARGEYIAFLDADDSFLPTKLDKQVHAAMKTGHDFIVSDYELVDEKGHSRFILSKTAPLIDFEMLKKENMIGCSTVFIKQELIKRHLFDDSFFHEDYICWLECLKECGFAYSIQEPLTRYCFSKGTKSANKLRSAKEVFLIYKKYFSMGFLQSHFYFFSYIHRKINKYRRHFYVLPSDKPMIVMDNIIYSLQRVGGISVYWSELLKRLMKDERFDVRLLNEKGCDDNLCFQNLSEKAKEFFAPKRGPVLFTRFCNPSTKEPAFFLFHSSYYRSIYAKNAKNIVTVYDFTYQYFYHGLKRFLHIFQQKRAVLNADVVLCISNHTKKDLLTLVPGAKKKEICTIPLAYDSAVFYPLEEQERKNEVLFIGSRAAYKNFSLAVQAVKKSEGMTLVIAGDALTKKETLYLNQMIPGRYRVETHPSSERVAALYRSAFCLAYLSKYEGFGLPVLEAMACACPVIALKTSGVFEISGEAALLIEREDPIEVAKAIQTLKINQEYYKNIQEKGIQNALTYSWDTTYEKTAQIYLEIMQ